MEEQSLSECGTTCFYERQVSGTELSCEDARKAGCWPLLGARELANAFPVPDCGEKYFLLLATLLYPLQDRYSVLSQYTAHEMMCC